MSLPLLRARALSHNPIRTLSSTTSYPLSNPLLPCTVLKFGGSSVGSSDAIKRSGAIISASRASGTRTTAVLSAMLGVTNQLLEIARRAASGDGASAARGVSLLLDAHVAVARATCTSRAAGEACAEELASERVRVNAACGNLVNAGARGASSRVEGQFATDTIASVGEQWVSRIMAAHLRDTGLDAVYADAVDIIITDGVPGNSRPLLVESQERANKILIPLLDRGAVPIVTGFFGASREGRLTTLGRGGSDLSAAVLGHCVKANAIRLYKVEHEAQGNNECTWIAGWVGVVHDADPATTIPELHYEEARELAHFAKKVLHPETVSPAVDAKIPIEVRNTLDASHPGTHISDGGQGEVGPVGRVQTVTHQPLSAYERTHSASGFGVDVADVAALRGVKREEAALVALVGFGIMRLDGLAGRAVKLLHDAGIPATVPKFVNGSQHSLSVLVPDVRRKEALKILHRSFVQQRA
jgi:aspartokinase